MRTRVVTALLALLGLTASGCIFEEATRDGAQCSETGSCPAGQRCSSDGQCLYPCPFAGSSCGDGDCGCGGIERPDMPNSGSGWRCLADGLCHFACTTDPNSGDNCAGYMHCDHSVGVCRPACSGPEQCADGASCVPVPGMNEGTGDPRPPNYCIGSEKPDDGGVVDGAVRDGGIPDAEPPPTGYRTDEHLIGGDLFALAVGPFASGHPADIVVAQNNNSQLIFFLAQGDGTFTRGGTITAGNKPFWVGLTQVDGDAFADVVTLSTYESRIDVRLGDGSGGTSYVDQTNVLPWTPTAAVLAKLDHGGLADLVMVSNARSELVTAFADGTGQMVIKPAVSTVGDPRALVAADVNSDGWDDIIVTADSNNGLYAMLSTGDGSFSNGGGISDIAGPNGGTPATLAAGSFDDGPRPDIAVALYDHGVDAIKVLYNWPDPGFYVGGIPDTVDYRTLFTGDFDGDGHLDLGGLTHRDDQKTDVFLFRNNGTGGFETGRRFTVDGLAWSVGVGAFNGDDCADIAVTLSTGKLAVLVSRSCPPWTQ